METCFGLERCPPSSDLVEQGEPLDDGEVTTVFAVSDSTGSSSHLLVSSALKQFPKSQLQTVTVCNQVRSLEEINHIVEEALEEDSMIVFTFASPGMSRYI